MKFSAQQIAALLGGKITGDANRQVWDVGSIETAKEGQLTFLCDAKYLAYLPTTQASVVLMTASIPFEGETSAGNIHYALYPFSHEVEYYYDNYANQREYHLNLPQKQIYTKNSFSRKSFPMVGKKYAGDEEFSFKNLCGVLVVQLTGSETVKSITFSSLDTEGKPMPVSGHARVNLNYDEVPTLVIDTEVYNKFPVYENVTLICNEGVALNPSTPTPFYIVLPPGTYHSPQLIISTASGKMMLKESNNPLTIQRSRSAKVTSMTFTETIPVNLSERGTSNSYIVSDSGIYSFDASVIGNGSAGILEGANFHTTDPSITPSKNLRK